MIGNFVAAVSSRFSSSLPVDCRFRLNSRYRFWNTEPSYLLDRWKGNYFVLGEIEAEVVSGIVAGRSFDQILNRVDTGKSDVSLDDIQEFVIHMCRSGVVRKISS